MSFILHSLQEFFTGLTLEVRFAVSTEVKVGAMCAFPPYALDPSVVFALAFAIAAIAEAAIASVFNWSIFRLVWLKLIRSEGQKIKILALGGNFVAVVIIS